MKQNFTIEGPFGELSGVINLCEVEAKQRNVLVIAHGFRGSMDGGGRARLLADEIGESICTVVRFNFSWCTMLSNQIAELKSVLDFVRETLKPEKLFLLGRSFGGATSIVVACEEAVIKNVVTENINSKQVEKENNLAEGSAAKLVADKDTTDKIDETDNNKSAAGWWKRNTYRPYGMVLWSAPNSLKSTFVQVLGEDVFQAALQGKTIVLDDERGHDEIPPAFVTDLLKYDVAELLKKWQQGPLLIIHGGQDCIVSPDQATVNFEIAGGDKELHYMEGDNHHLDLHYKEAGELVKNWLKKNI